MSIDLRTFERGSTLWAGMAKPLKLLAAIWLYASEALRQVMLLTEFIEQTYKTCIGLKRLVKLYGKERFLGSLTMCFAVQDTYGLLNQILINNFNLQERINENLFTTPRHQNVRGLLTYH